MPFSESSVAQSHNLMKYVCEPGRVWLLPRRLGRVKQANIVRYPYPGRPHIFYARRYVVPHNPRTPAQVLMRQLFGALSRDWLALLTPPQRDAWTVFARYYNRRWGAAWIDCARQLNRCSPHILTAFHRRIIRRWLVGGRPLSGQQAYVKFNSRVGRIGRPKILWPPPPPAPFRPNPVQEVRMRWDAGRLRLELLPQKPTLWRLWTGSQGGGHPQQQRRTNVVPISYQYRTNIAPPSHHRRTNVVPTSYLRRTMIPRLAQEGRKAEAS